MQNNDGDKLELGRADDHSARPPSAGDINPLASPADIDAQLERMRKIGDAGRNEKWANFRQILTISAFSAGMVVITFSLLFSIYILLTKSADVSELAKWILETLLGGLIAGLIGFWAVKSFER